MAVHTKQISILQMPELQLFLFTKKKKKRRLIIIRRICHIYVSPINNRTDVPIVFDQIQSHAKTTVSDKQSTQEFPLGAEMFRRSKASKITTQRLDNLEV